MKFQILYRKIFIPSFGRGIFYLSILCLSIFCLGLNSVALATAVETTKTISNQEPSTILVLGDSLSAAHNMPIESGWVYLLQKRLETKKLPYRVVNLSSSGDTSRNGVLKLNLALEEYHPSIVILGLGSNDGLRGLSPEAMQNNLSKMITLAKKANAKVLLIGFLIPTNYGPRYRQKFEQVFTVLPQKYDLLKVPFLLDKVALSKELMQDDGYHPTAAAQEIILDNVWLYLEKML